MISAFVVAALLQAVQPNAADEAFIRAARAGSEAFQDRNAAIRAGYRLLGPEIPEMGEHWINPILVVEARFDPKRPPMLTYATINGKPTLTGVGYAVALRPGEAAPPTGISGKWHDHVGSVTDELSRGKHASQSSGARVVVLHAWVWLDNPGGVFSDANWALPYVRRGRAAPAVIDAHAARALSLLDGGVKYYADVLRDLTGTDFTSELQQTAAEVQRRNHVDHGRLWQEMVRRIQNRLKESERDDVGQALGIGHDH